jgi:hypothetical protein
MAHTDHVTGWTGTPEELVTAIGDLRYDALAQFLALLASEISRQAVNDRSANRRILATRLQCVSDDLTAAQQGMQAAWKICKPFMD